ncbi:MAG: GNAT family N-acetyltransferase [Actinobacteria bacterium]|nr:GNAT family N-acetyltransferase [Actinomycetota bacterium]MCA1719947.1 GNAT family N-acetyltransferase [Actinomycetota bacterium]
MQPHAAELADVHERTAVVAYAHIFDAPFPRELTQQKWARYPGEVLEHREDGVLLGFAATDEGRLDALFVLPEHAGRGIGSRLLERAAGVDRLWVLEDNTPARGFYERRGWTCTRARRDAFGVQELLYVRVGAPAPAAPPR